MSQRSPMACVETDREGCRDVACLPLPNWLPRQPVVEVQVVAR